jgi:hypothetical protein
MRGFAWPFFSLILPVVLSFQTPFLTSFFFLPSLCILSFLFYFLHFVACYLICRQTAALISTLLSINTKPTTATMIITRALSITNFVVASSALSFQVGVLYPWHKQLDDDFEALKREHLRVLTAVEGKIERTQDTATLEENRQGIRSMLGNLVAWKA